MPGIPAAPRSAVNFNALLYDVQAARLDVATQRGIGASTQPDLSAARGRLLSALEVYTGALEAAGVPVPYKMRDELALCRRVSRRDGY